MPWEAEMKRFWRTIGGKVILFLTVIVCFYAVIGSAIGVYVMANWSSDFYSSSEEALQKDMIDSYTREQVQRKLLPYVYGDELPSTEDGGTSLRYRISIAHIVGSTEVSSNHFNGVQAKMANLAYTYYFAKGVYHNAEDGWIDLLELSEQEVQTLAPGSDYYNCTLAEIYTVEAYVDESVQVIDRIYLIREIVHIAYAMRYRIVIVAAAAFVLGLVAFIALMCVTGKRREDEEIHLGPIARVPLDVLLGVILFGAFIAYLVLDEGAGFIVSFALVILWVHLLLGFCMDIAARIKAKTLFKNTLIYRIFRGILQLFKTLPLTWKAVLALGIFWLFEMIVYLGIRFQPGMVVVSMVLERIVLFVLIIMGVFWMKKLQEAGKRMAAGDLSYKVDTKNMWYSDLKQHGEDLNSISVGMQRAVEQQMKSERMKTELITNVSHDIKTPLTSIINYADLISKEETDNENIKEYAEVLTRQSARLKRLIEDLVEASRASTGNLEVVLTQCEAATFVEQAAGEYEERLQAQNLTLVTQCEDAPMPIMADGRRMWRVFDNLMNNICKYAQPGTRVYLTLSRFNNNVLFTFKNTSREALNISAEELMERFVRGDESRHTEGNGLGLSIARSLTELQGGNLNLIIDGDLFKAILRFPIAGSVPMPQGQTVMPQQQMVQPQRGVRPQATQPQGMQPANMPQAAQPLSSQGGSPAIKH